jgi:hypothetical protein
MKTVTSVDWGKPSADYNQKKFQLSVIQRVVSIVALLALSAFAYYWASTLFLIGLGIGVAFRYEINQRITDLFVKIMFTPTTSLIAIPTAFLLYWLSWPGAIVVQAVFAGASLGSELALGAEKFIASHGRVGLLWV